MAVKKVDIFLLTLPNKNIDDALTKIISNNVRVEFLNPADLGGEWENVTKWKHEKSVDNSEKITLLDFVLSQYSPKVFLAGLQDLRVDAKRSDIDSAWQKKEELLEIAKKLSYFKGLEEDRSHLQPPVLSTVQPPSTILCGVNTILSLLVEGLYTTALDGSISRTVEATDQS